MAHQPPPRCSRCEQDLKCATVTAYLGNGGHIELRFLVCTLCQRQYLPDGSAWIETGPAFIPDPDDQRDHP